MFKSANENISDYKYTHFHTLSEHKSDFWIITGSKSSFHLLTYYIQRFCAQGFSLFITQQVIYPRSWTRFLFVFLACIC